MDVRQFFECVGGNYDEIISRMLNDDRVIKFLKMFPRDKSYSDLVEAMANDDIEAAFAAAHTLKGVTANLSLTRLSQMASDITEALRNGQNVEQAKSLMPELKKCYEEVSEGIEKI